MATTTLTRGRRGTETTRPEAEATAVSGKRSIDLTSVRHCCIAARCSDTFSIKSDGLRIKVTGLMP